MIKIYKNLAANAIFIEDANGAQFINSIQATTDDPTSTKMNIFDSVEQIYLVYQEEFTEFVNENGVQWGADANATINALNAIFQNSGTPTGNPPIITSPLTISLVEGQVLNYELTASDGVGYEWDFSSVSGVTTVDGNIRKIIGGSSLGAGTYNIPIKAINYNGEDSETIVLTVNTPPFSNTKSILFNNQQWMGGNAALLASTLGRTGNGSGASDAWSINFWVKCGTGSNNSQTLFYFGDNDTTNSGHINIRYLGGLKKIRMQYGSNNNYIRLETPNYSVNASQWINVLITYDGGTTGASSGNLSAYYGRFNIYLNGTLQTTTNSHNNFGYTGNVDSDNFRFGRLTNGNYLRGCNLDEVNVWDSDQSQNIADIYNSGVVFDTMTLTNQPKHRWRFEDSYPNQLDTGTSANCTMVQNSMTSANNVNDVP